MKWRRVFVLAGVLALSSAGVAGAAGFGIFEQGTRAMGMAGAFTAQADDPSALFHNVGGLAFFEESAVSVGFTYITNTKADFFGANPFPGEGVTDEQETLQAFPPHFYWIKPFNGSWNFGLSVNAPFGLVTEWDDDFPGRFISKRAELTVVDVTPNLGVLVSENFGIGFGPIVRVAAVELIRNVPQINPFTTQVADIAEATLESDFETGVGWQAGLLHRVTDRFSWGFSYRSDMEIDFGGDASFQQILTGFPQLDALVAMQLPFGTDVPISTTIDFPDMASLGLAFGVTENVTVEIDANYAGWSALERIVIAFGGGLPDTVLNLEWDDSNNYRLGVRWDKGETEWRFGYVFDENPIEDRNLNPLLPDSDRNGFTIGWGREGEKADLDLALMYLPFEDRETLVNENGFNGSYETTAVLFGATLTF